MKQVLTHINPKRCFDDGRNVEAKEHERMAKIQIENSLRLGWKPEDILLVTNFEYEYMGVKSVVIGDENFCEHFFPATKAYVIAELFNKGLIGDELYWYHDFDCFQLNPLNDIEKDMEGADMGLTNYGRVPRLCSASMFFKKSAKDIFIKLKEDLIACKGGEEGGIMKLRLDPKLKERIKVLNNTYAFQKWNMWHSYCRSAKPIKAVHFHITPDKYDFFVRGNNRVNLKIIPEELVEIFHKYGFTG
jgi:hypothetical protein